MKTQYCASFSASPVASSCSCDKRVKRSLGWAEGNSGSGYLAGHIDRGQRTEERESGKAGESLEHSIWTVRGSLKHSGPAE